MIIVLLANNIISVYKKPVTTNTLIFFLIKAKEPKYGK
jgi:hypothetical protein